MIAYKVIIWISNPEACWSLISVEQTPRPFSFHDKIIFNHISLFDSVFDKDCVTLSVEGEIVYQPQVLGAMDGESSVKRVMDGITNGIRLLYFTNQMEMDWVSSLFKSLPYIVELCVSKMSL